MTVDADSGEEPVSEALRNAKMPSECFGDIQDELQRFYVHNGHYFKTKEECEYFFMLPLSDVQRSQILTKLTKK